MAKKKKKNMKNELKSLINTLETSKGNQIVPHLEIIEEEEGDLEEETPEEILEKLDTEEELAGVKHVPSFMQDSDAAKASASEAKETAATPPEPESIELNEIDLAEAEPENATTSADVPAAPPAPPAEKVKIYEPTGELWGDVSVFMEELIDSYAERYDIWEESTNQVLDVLRHLQMINQENSEILIETIEKVHKKIELGLQKFKQKRDYIEKMSDSNYQRVARMLKKTLDLLSLQLKEIKLKNLLNQLYEIYA